MKFALLFFSLTLLTARAGEPEFADVFISNQEGYASIRIPAVIVTKAGTVLAFAEGRAKPADQAENDIVEKRSVDGGRTWSALRVIHDDGTNSLNNPTVVQERESGRIFLMYQRIPAHLKEHSAATATGLDGPDIYRNLLVSSDDDGVTWSAPRDVTATTKRPQRATTIASGPGIGIQLSRGAKKGRLIFPFNEGPYGQWQNFAVFSDDAGKTWSFGADVPGALVPDGKGGERSQMNEVQMVELSDGAVRLSSRQFFGEKVRRTSISRDGGATWSAVAELPELRDPSCMAGLLRWSFDDGAGRGKLIHTGPDSNAARSRHRVPQPRRRRYVAREARTVAGRFRPQRPRAARGWNGRLSFRGGQLSAHRLRALPDRVARSRRQIAHAETCASFKATAPATAMMPPATARRVGRVPSMNHARMIVTTGEVATMGNTTPLGVVESAH